MKIRSIGAYQVYDSRGNPTVEAEIELESGVRGRGTVPSGASTGQFEALELRDGDPARFRGKSVFKAIGNIHREIAPALAGFDVRDQAGLETASSSNSMEPLQNRGSAPTPFSPSRWPPRQPRLQPSGAPFTIGWANPKARFCHCPRYKLSAAARTRIGAQTSRTSSSSLLARAPIRKSWR